MLMVAAAADLPHGLIDSSLYEELQYSYQCRRVTVMTVHAGTPKASTFSVYEMQDTKVCPMARCCAERVTAMSAFWRLLDFFRLFGNFWIFFWDFLKSLEIFWLFTLFRFWKWKNCQKISKSFFKKNNFPKILQKNAGCPLLGTPPRTISPSGRWIWVTSGAVQQNALPLGTPCTGHARNSTAGLGEGAFEPPPPPIGVSEWENGVPVTEDMF